MPDKPLLQVIDLKKYFPFGSKKENRAVKAVDGVSFLIMVRLYLMVLI